MKEQPQNVTEKGICIVVPIEQNVQGRIASIYSDILQKHGFKIIKVDSTPMLRIKALFDLIKLRNEYEYIHVHASGYLGDIRLLWAYIVSKIFKKGVIITYHCGSPDRILKNTHYIVNIIFNFAILITVPSKYSKNILLKYNPSIAKKLKVFPNLIDPSKYTVRNVGIKKNKKMVLTVGNINKWYIYRKGLLIFVKSAKFLPDVEFYLVGKYDKSIDILKKEAPKNVHFMGYLSDKELIKLYKISNVYCQLSRSESFGVALVEAMLCECVPVVSDRGALPEVVGDTGFYVRELTPEETVRQIEKAIHSDLGREAKERIINNFSIEKREEELIKMISEVVGD
jgi:glycosyltransferase involved in cell wall biosynthesis